MWMSPPFVFGAGFRSPVGPSAPGMTLAHCTASLFSQGTNQQIKAHEASSAVQHVNLLKEWSSSLERKVRAGPCSLLLSDFLRSCTEENL